MLRNTCNKRHVLTNVPQDLNRLHAMEVDSARAVQAKNEFLEARNFTHFVPNGPKVCGHWWGYRASVFHDNHVHGLHGTILGGQDLVTWKVRGVEVEGVCL